jgi:hypothetical protein
MSAEQTPRVSSFLATAMLLAIFGWGGLAALVLFTLPTVGPRWLFFFLSFLAFTGTTLPVIAFLNRRFPGSPPVSHSAILRQAMWVGIYGSTLVWLQIGRVLTPTIALLLAVGLGLIEWLLRLRERSQWNP